jgi:hypothetical protein
MEGLSGKTDLLHHRPHRFSLMKRVQVVVYQLLNNNVFGVYWDLVQAVLAVFSFTLYCAEMSLQEKLPLWILVVESVLAFIFLVDYVLYFAAAERKVVFMMSWYSTVDLLSLFPPVATLPTLYLGGLGPSLQFLRILRLFRAYRLIEISTTGGPSDATISRQVLMLLCTVSTYVLTCAGAVHAFERQWPGSFVEVVGSGCDYPSLYSVPPYARPPSCSLNLLAALYFSLITSLTVGFGSCKKLKPWLIVHRVLCCISAYPFRDSQVTLSLERQGLG